MVTQSFRFRYRRSVFSTRMARQVGLRRRNVNISPKPVRPLRLAVSTSVNSQAMEIPWSKAYCRSSFCWAGMEKPSFSCSLEETRA
jgi:hypothetical protein